MDREDTSGEPNENDIETPEALRSLTAALVSVPVLVTTF